MVESDPSCGLTQFASVRGFGSVAAYERATAHSRAWDPTSCFLSSQLADLSAIASVSRDIRTRGMLEVVVATRRTNGQTVCS